MCPTTLESQDWLRGHYKPQTLMKLKFFEARKRRVEFKRTGTKEATSTGKDIKFAICRIRGVYWAREFTFNLIDNWILYLSPKSRTQRRK